MDDQTILVEQHGKAGLIRLNRPEVLNALNHASMKDLLRALHDLDHNPAIGCIVITGSERAFAAGADISEMAPASPSEMMTRGYIELWDQIGEIEKPIIAAVSGWCLGGGCELALACDMILASESARFGQPEITLGVMTGAGASQRLAATIGKALTMEMVLNNRTLTAEEALRFGLVNRIVPVDACLNEALEMAAEIADRAPLAVRLSKKIVNMAFEMPLSQGIAAERQFFYMLFDTADQKEGMQAFLEKRQAQWQGK